MTHDSLIYYVRKNKNLPNYLKRELINVLNSPLYRDTETIISTLDLSPKSIECAKKFKKLNPLSIYNKEQLFEFKIQLRIIKEEALTCSINPYFFTSTRTNSHIRTLGDIIAPNSNTPVTINELIINPKYQHLNKPKLIKDYLITWNREAKKYLEKKAQENHEYLAKSHHVVCFSKPLIAGTIITFVTALLAAFAFFTKELTDNSVLYILLVFLGFGLTSITNAIVNSFHSRKLRKYDTQMAELDKLYNKYVDHTFNIEAYALKKVHQRKLCSLPLNKINIIGPAIKDFDIGEYVFSEEYISNKKYWFLKAIAFIGFVVAVACTVLLFAI